ncbi:MAG TPA: hypothetical protein VML50_10820 [Anaeromyxobacter sp.]|nr:hypothetical protein [Anaeromyxobacter sp.]
MAGEPRTAGIDFGVLIAFLAPGFVAYSAVAQVSPLARAWIDAAGEKQQDFGVFLFVALAALALGLAVSGLRALAVDRVFLSDAPALRWLRIEPPVVDWSKVTNDTDLAIVITLRDAFYRYFQFYANMAVALLAWVVVRVAGRWGSGALGAWRERILIGLTLAGVAVLLASAHDSLARYAEALARRGFLEEEDDDEQRLSRPEGEAQAGPEGGGEEAAARPQAGGAEEAGREGEGAAPPLTGRGR